jgi:DNA-binding NarL/FixJ family response regulator
MSGAIGIDNIRNKRTGIRHALEATGEFVVLAEVGTVNLTLQWLEKTYFDMIVTSLWLSDQSSMLICRKVVEQHLQIPIVILGPTDSDTCLTIAWKVGAAVSIIDKMSDTTELIQALQQTASNQQLWTSS